MVHPVRKRLNPATILLLGPTVRHHALGVHLLRPRHLLALLEARDFSLNALGLLLEYRYLTINVLVLGVRGARHHAIRMHGHGQLLQWLVVHALVVHLIDQGAQLQCLICRLCGVLLCFYRRLVVHS